MTQVWRQEFQCDCPIEFCIEGFIDNPHAACAEHFQDFEVGDGLARQAQLGICSHLGYG